MDLGGFRHLLTPSGQQALSDAGDLQPDERDFLAHFQVLCRRYPADLARAALETAIMRRAASSKFPAAGRMFFTREALEQASSFEIAVYRALRYRDQSQVADLGCSIGGDTLALASGPAPVVGIDIEGLRLAMARQNLCAQGLGERAVFTQANLVDPLPVLPGTALFFDPARRSRRRLFFSANTRIGCHPTLAAPSPGVKISPGVDLA
jgi:SAM-dependent methyltransferase